MTNELINYDDQKVIEALKATVAQGLTDAEYWLFANICKATGLNPIKREIWAIKSKGYTKADGTVVEGKLQIMTGIAGYLTIANRHPQYDGLECEVEYGKDGRPVRAIAKVHRKDRKFPSVAIALWSEFYIPGRTFNNKYTPGTWDTKSSVMIAKCAKSMALKEAFPQEINGIDTEEFVEAQAVDNSPRPNLVPLDKPKEKDFYYNTLLLEDPEKRIELEEWFRASQCEEVEKGIFKSPIQSKKYAHIKVDRPSDGAEGEIKVA